MGPYTHAHTESIGLWHHQQPSGTQGFVTLRIETLVCCALEMPHTEARRRHRDILAPATNDTSTSPVESSGSIFNTIAHKPAVLQEFLKALHESRPEEASHGLLPETSLISERRRNLSSLNAVRSVQVLNNDSRDHV